MSRGKSGYDDTARGALKRAPPVGFGEVRDMDFEELVRSRRSVRGFKKEPVPRAVIAEIIEVAKRAPSSMNTQPWHVHALTGEPLDEVRRRGSGHHDLRRHGISRRRIPRQWRAVGPQVAP
jgi:hypothetical protein